MARRRTMRRPRLLDVLLLAGAASGTTITLSGFEIIATFSVPLSCIFAYNTPIRGCSISDFAQGNMCSETCRDGLERVQANIQASCASVNAAPGSLLYQAQNGKLLESVCEDAPQGNAPTTVQSTPASTPEPQPSTPTSTPPRSNKPASTEEFTTTTATSTVTRSVRQSPKPSSTSRSTSKESTVRNTPTSTVPTRDSSTKSTTTTVPRASNTQEAASTSTTKTDRARQTLLPGSGGGSPFDFVAAGEPLRPLGFDKLMGAVVAVMGLALV